MDDGVNWSVAEAAVVARLTEQLLAGSLDPVGLEVAVTRLALARLLRQVADPIKLVEGVAKGAVIVFRARQIELAQAAARARDDEEALKEETDQILIAMGLGPDGPATQPGWSERPAARAAGPLDAESADGEVAWEEDWR